MIQTALLLLALAQAGAEPETPECAVARALTRDEDSGATALEVAAAELARLDGAAPILLEALGSGRAPACDEAGEAVLGAGQVRLLCAALRQLGPARLHAFVTTATQRPERRVQVAAALRVLALDGPADAGALLRLARAAEAAGFGTGVEDALPDLLRESLAGRPSGTAEIVASWSSLGPLTASLAASALESLDTMAAGETLRGLLGRRAEYDACLLVALGNTIDLWPAVQAEPLARELGRYLAGHASAQAQAAAFALGRLESAEAVPLLIGLLDDDDRELARAALAALRASTGVALADSPRVWSGWLAREESWWEERAPGRLEALDQAREDEAELAELVPLLRELSEHPLHRAELAGAVAGLLELRDPVTRVLVCQALERLGSREALPALCRLLDARDPRVVSAAHAALVHITREELPPGRAAWRARLAARGLLPPE